MKKRLFELDLIRVIAIFSILIYHFTLNDREIFEVLKIGHYSNIHLGHFGVSLFLILSGTALVISEKEKFSIKEFYKKRIKAIFPLYYLTFILFYIKTKITNPYRFCGVRKLSIIYTILGLDGLLSHWRPTFYLVGEWFIGCILIFYLFYPLLRKLIDKYPKITFIVLLLTNILIILNYNITEIPFFFSPAVRFMEFVIGIYIGKYFIKNELYKNKKLSIGITIGSILLFIIFAFIQNNLNTMFNIITCGISAFMIIFYLGRIITIERIKKIVSWFAKYSFAIFLVHHQIENTFYARTQNITLTRINWLILLILYLVIVIALGFILKKICDFIMSKLFKKKESK